MTLALAETPPALPSVSTAPRETPAAASEFRLPENRAGNEEPPEFPVKNQDRIKLGLKPALEAYRKGDYEKAAVETKKALDILPKGPTAEYASFFLGDIYARLGEEGDTDFLQAALTTYHDAIVAWPESDHIPRALWKSGVISSRLNLHYESIAIYKRILTKYPKSKFVSKARLGIARSYQAWGKWKEAMAAYTQIKPADLAPEDQPLAVLGIAETLYSTGDYPHAYTIFSSAIRNYPALFNRDPMMVFHFGDSAFQTGHNDEAKEYLLKFYNVFPRDPLTLVVLAKLINIFELEENAKEVIGLIDIIQNLYPGPQGTKITDLISRMEEIKTQKCLKKSRKKGLVDFTIEKCAEEKTRQARIPRNDVADVGEMVDDLLKEPPSSAMIQRFIYQEGEQFRLSHLPLMSFEIQKRLYPFVESSPFQKEVLVARNQAAAEAIDQGEQASHGLKIVELYLKNTDVLTGKMLFSPTGTKIARSLIQNGFYSQALPILEMAVTSASQSQTDEIYYLYTVALIETGESRLAGKKLDYILKAYPDSPYRAELMERLGNLLLKEKKYDLAIDRFKTWLVLFPSAPEKGRIATRLASAYDKKSEFREAISVYRGLVRELSPADPILYLKLGEDYYQTGAFKEAISVFEKVLASGRDRKLSDWAHYRIAECYRATHQNQKEREVLSELVKSSEDPIYKSLALERISTKEEVSR